MPLKILQKNAGLLTQEELLELLREGDRRADARAGDPTSGALPSERRLYQGQLLPSAGPPHAGGAAGCRAALAALAAELRALGLSRREVLMCADLRPRSAVELHAIVADCDDRLGEGAEGGEGGGDQGGDEGGVRAKDKEEGGGGDQGGGGGGVARALAAVERHLARRRQGAAEAAAEAARLEQAARRRGGGAGAGGVR